VCSSFSSPNLSGRTLVGWSLTSLFSTIRLCHSPEANQILQDLWPSPGLVHYIYIHSWGLLLPNGILPAAKFTLHPSLAFSYIAGVTARQSNSSRQPNCCVVQGMELNFKFRGCDHKKGISLHGTAFSYYFASKTGCLACE